LQRLQQILFYRELGLPLAAIRQVLDDRSFDRIASLRGHRAKLEADIVRYRRLIRTIDRTIDVLEQGARMTDDQFFDGFSAEKQAQWERELQQQFGDHATARIADSKAALGKMTEAERRGLKAEIDSLHEAFAGLLDRGEDAGSAATQALVACDHAWVFRSWTPTAEAYAGLGRLYVEHPDFRSTFENIRHGLGDYLAEAMRHYSEHHLSGPAAGAGGASS